MNQPQTKKTSSRSYKRRVRNILIHRPMQREFTLVVIALLMVSSLAIGFVIHETIREAAFGGGFRFGKVNPIEVLGEVRYQLILRVSLILFASLIVLGTFGVFFLHRIAGPVYRFRQVFLRINKGEVREIPVPVRLREGDFFHETALEINRMIRRLRLDEQKIRFAKEKISEIMAQGPSESMGKTIHEMREFLEQNPE